MMERGRVRGWERGDRDFGFGFALGTAVFRLAAPAGAEDAAARRRIYRGRRAAIEAWRVDFDFRADRVEVRHAIASRRSGGSRTTGSAGSSAAFPAGAGGASRAAATAATGRTCFARDAARIA